MEVPRKLEKPKMTEFALDMAKLSIDVPTLWLKDMLTDAKVNKSSYLQNDKYIYKILEDGEYVMELSGSAACKGLLEWCQENGYNKYETTPIKLGIFLKTKKWSGFKKGRKTNTADTNYYYVDRLLETLEKETE